jgi:hypothetical protein
MVSGRQRLMSLAAAAALGACCLAAAGCGGNSSAAPDPLANQTGTKVLAEAVADLEAAPGLTMNGAGIDAGEYVTSYIGIVPGKGCNGSVIQGEQGADGILTYTTIGQTVYFKPDSTMWQAMAGADATKITASVGGRYVKDPLSDGNLHGIGSCAIAGPVTADGAVTKGQVTVLNGIQVVPIKDSLGDVMYVTDTSRPEVVQDDTAPLAGTTDPAGEYTFTIGALVKLTPPPAKQVISGASIHL